MTTTNDGGPAMPVPMIPCDNSGGHTSVQHPGLSKRELFAATLAVPEELGWVAAALMGIIAFFIGREFLYSVLGTTIDAKVTRQSNEQRSAGRNGGTYSVVVVDYSFAETSGRQRQERDEIRFGSDIAVSDTVSVEYIPRVAGFSRVRGKSNRVIAMLTACTIPLLIVFGVLWWTDQSRFGAIMIWGGVFLMATIDAVAMSILPLRDHSIQHDWLGILTIFVCLVFAAMGYLGMWFSLHTRLDSRKTREVLRSQLHRS